MPEISKITLPSGVTYDIKDTTARATAAGSIQLKGSTTTPLTDEATTNPITINGNSYTAVNQDAVFYDKKEFVFDGTKWHEFGDMSGLGDLAYEDSASGTYTPAGTVSTPTITVTPTTTTKYVAGSATGGGSVTAGSAASCTLPVMTTSVVNETLSIGWSAGSFTANTPTAVTLPTFSSQIIATGITSATSSQPTFSGTAATIEVS